MKPLVHSCGMKLPRVVCTACRTLRFCIAALISQMICIRNECSVLLYASNKSRVYSSRGYCRYVLLVKGEIALFLQTPVGPVRREPFWDPPGIHRRPVFGNMDSLSRVFQGSKFMSMKRAFKRDPMNGFSFLAKASHAICLAS